MTPGPRDAEAEALLDFWFPEALDDAQAVEDRVALWFGVSERFDRELARRFGALARAAADGALDGWGETPRGALALVLLLDQLPRNLHRGRPEAFASDERALGAATRALARGFDTALHPVEAAFLLLPFEHAENAAQQERSVALFERLARRAPAPIQEVFEGFVRHAREHRDVVRRFGRFPTRNEALSRTSTPAERAWIASGAGRPGP